MHTGAQTNVVYRNKAIHVWYRLPYMQCNHTHMHIRWWKQILLKLSSNTAKSLLIKAQCGSNHTKHKTPEASQKFKWHQPSSNKLKDPERSGDLPALSWGCLAPRCLPGTRLGLRSCWCGRSLHLVLLEVLFGSPIGNATKGTDWIKLWLSRFM